MKTLLHACCGPCSLEPVRLLKERGHELTIGYMNSNIHPESEYAHRLQTLLDWARGEGIPVVEGAYEPSAWKDAVGAPDTWGENHIERCRACYRMRLEAAAQYAADNGYEALSTTLAVSPYQFGDVIHEELRRACALHGLKAHYEDYRPYYDEATRISRELGMYRQNYCGCRYSIKEGEATRAFVKQRRREIKAAKAAMRQAEEAARAKKAAEKRAYAEAQKRKRAALKALRNAKG